MGGWGVRIWFRCLLGTPSKTAGRRVWLRGTREADESLPFLLQGWLQALPPDSARLTARTAISWHAQSGWSQAFLPQSPSWLPGTLAGPCPAQPSLAGPLQDAPTFGADPALLPNPCPRTSTQASQTPKPLPRWGQRPCTVCAPGAEGRATANPFPTGSVQSKQALSPGARRSPEQGSWPLPRPCALPSSPHSTDTDSGHRLAVQWGWGQVGSAEATPGS